RTHGGTGLGLPLAKMLVALHGGRLSIESKLGEGTVVRVWLPAAPTEAVAIPAPLRRSSTSH
ncbi:MAG: ATP-binding protein, partial [Dongiaceae bacterium]